MKLKRLLVKQYFSTRKMKIVFCTDIVKWQNKLECIVTDKNKKLKIKCNFLKYIYMIHVNIKYIFLFKSILEQKLLMCLHKRH